MHRNLHCFINVASMSHRCLFNKQACFWWRHQWIIIVINVISTGEANKSKNLCKSVKHWSARVVAFIPMKIFSNPSAGHRWNRNTDMSTSCSAVFTLEIITCKVETQCRLFLPLTLACSLYDHFSMLNEWMLGWFSLRKHRKLTKLAWKKGKFSQHYHATCKMFTKVPSKILADFSRNFFSQYSICCRESCKNKIQTPLWFGVGNLWMGRPVVLPTGPERLYWHDTILVKIGL